MSDDDDFADDMMEYSDGSAGEADIDIENQYYESKEMAEESPEQALEGLQTVVDLEEEKGKWGFKALKRMVKLNYKLQRYKELREKYKQLMTYTRKAVTMNEAEKAINSLLDFLSGSPNLNELYEITLLSLKESKNEKAYLRFQLRMAKMLQDRKDYVTLEKHLKELRKSCLHPDGREDSSKASQLMEVIALEILMHTERENNRKLKELYEKAKSLKSAINAPHITGIIYECGGKMYMREQNWTNAYTEFFQAFKDYDEFGSPKATQCLKYLVLANMLSSSPINPFVDPRAKAFQNKEDIQAMLNLVSAYQNSDINAFNTILEKNRKAIMEDDFMKHYMTSLLTNIRSRVIIKLISPYTRISLSFISGELKIPLAEVETLLITLILDNQIQGRVDQINQILELHSNKQSNIGRFKAVNKLSQQLVSLQSTVFARLSNYN